MERAEWLKQMREHAEMLYDRLSPQYWVTYGFYENETHRLYLQKFLQRITPPGLILSAGCGAGRYDGILLEAGHAVVGTDQSKGMLKKAREHFPQDQYPQLRYEKKGFLELSFQDVFDGVTCIDALEHVSPEEYPQALRKFQAALKPGGWLYFTVEPGDPAEDAAAYQRAQAQGLPVVYGEVVDKVNLSTEQIQALHDGPIPAELSDPAVYHFHPTLEAVRAWIDQAGLVVEEEGEGSGYHHFIARKR